MHQNDGELIYDALVVQRATLADLDTAKLERYFSQEIGQRLDDLPLPLETVLANLKVLGHKNGETLATIAGLLIFGRDPARWLPQAEPHYLFLPQGARLWRPLWHGHPAHDQVVPRGRHAPAHVSRV